MVRFVDRSDRKQLIKESTDFYNRHYGSFILWVAYALIISTLAISLHVNKVVYGIYSGLDTVPSGDVMLSIIFMVMVTLIVTGYLLIVIYNLRSLLTAVEFQNAMFAGGMRINTEFAVICNTKHTIVYVDMNALEIFGEKNVDHLPGILAHEGFAEGDKEKIKAAIAAGATEKVPMSYTRNGNKHIVVIHITPLSKPAGYFLIKAVAA